MSSIPSKTLSKFWGTIQGSLFSGLSEMVEETLTEKHKRLAAILEINRIEDYVPVRIKSSLGRPPKDIRYIARAFLAKAFFNIQNTKSLIQHLHTDPNLRLICGWNRNKDVPSSAVFSRAFAVFAAVGLCDQVHKALIIEHVSEFIVLDESLDSTAVLAREKATKKIKMPKEKRKRGRARKDEERPVQEEKRLDVQLKQSLEDAIADLPTDCDWGAKLDTGGHMYSWKGYKAHIVWGPDMIPFDVVTTSASVHDSQVAIPIMRRTAQYVKACYHLMDSAYDAPQIREASVQLGQVPIIDPNPRRSGVPEEKKFDPAMKRRYKERTNAERGNGRLKDEFGLRFLRVRGHAKAHLHIMFGILALFADQLLKPLTGS